MSIATMEALEGLPAGAVITIGDNSNTWERVEAGFMHKTGITLGLEHFQQEVSANRVVQGVRPERRQLWDDTTAPNYGYKYVLLDADTANPGRWWVARFYDNNSFADVVRVATVPGHLVVEKPEWVDLAYAMGHSALVMRLSRDEFRTQATTASTAMAEAQGALETMRTNVQRALHDIVRSNEKMREPLDAVLTQNGMLPAPVLVPVTVKGQYARRLTLPVEDVAAVLQAPDGAAVARVDGTTVVYFDVEFVKEVEGTRDVCACPRIGRRSVMEWCHEQKFTADLYDYRLTSRSCEAENCQGKNPF